MKAALYLEVFGIAEDADGNDCPTGLKFDFGVTANKTPDLDKLNADEKFKQDILKLACLDGIVAPNSARFISEEYYEQEYGDEEE